MSLAPSKPQLIVRLCEPRGFCAGVDRAIQIVVLALKKFGAPVYVRHEIVHNRHVVERLDWKGPVFVISALESEGTEALSQAIMRYLDERAVRIAEEPEYAEALAELDRQIEDEARARLQELDDQRALRRAGVKSVEEADDDDFDDDDDDEGGAEIIYVR